MKLRILAIACCLLFAASSSLASAKTESVSPRHPGEATVAVVNVYDSIKARSAGTKNKELPVLPLPPMSVSSGAPPDETGQRAVVMLPLREESRDAAHRIHQLRR